MLIYSSPQLIAVSHVLRRLLMPRHSPYALLRLNFLQLLAVVLFELSEFHFTNIVLVSLSEKASYFRTTPLLIVFHLAISRFGEIVVFTQI